MNSTTFALAVIIASVREGRFGPVVADWFVGQAKQRDDVNVDVIDLADTPIPSANFASRIGAADAFVVVYADAAAVSEAVGAAGEPVILCGHSYGGTVITEAGAGEPNVRHLIYITSVLPGLGRSPEPPRIRWRHSANRCVEWPGARSRQPSWSAPKTAQYRWPDNGRRPRRSPEPSRSPAGITRSRPNQKHWPRSSPTQRADRPLVATQSALLIPEHRRYELTLRPRCIAFCIQNAVSRSTPLSAVDPATFARGHWTPRRSCSMLCG